MNSNKEFKLSHKGFDKVWKSYQDVAQPKGELLQNMVKDLQD